MPAVKNKAPMTWRDRLHDPLQLKVMLAAGLLLLALGAYQLFNAQIVDLDRKIAKEHKYSALHAEVSGLRSQMAGIEARLPTGDVNEWGQYVLTEIRQSPLKLRSMEPGKAASLGPYKVVVLQMELEGSLQELDRFLHWLETNVRLFRVSKIGITPSRSDRDVLIMQLSVTGVMG